MATCTIDTHATIRELEDAGMDSRQTMGRTYPIPWSGKDEDVPMRRVQG